MNRISIPSAITMAALTLSPTAQAGSQVAAEGDAPISPRSTIDNVAELGFSLGSVNRSGIAVVQSTPTDEPTNFEHLEIDARYARQIGDRYRFQIAFRHEENNVGDFFRGEETDDTHVRANLADLQFGHVTGDLYLGGFLGYGRIAFVPDDTDVNTDFRTAGLAAAIHRGNWSLGAQIGRFDTDSENAESIDDADFQSLIGQYHLDNDRTSFGFRLSRVDGLTDNDSSTPDPTETLEARLFFEHELSGAVLGGSPRLIGGIAYTDVSETDLPGPAINHRLFERQAFLGLTVTFGTKTPRERARRFAYRLPKIETWLGQAPPLD